MQNQPLVSIIVISYNHSRFIKENLDSIKAQTYSNIELIVGDDASQDNSVEVFEEWLKDNHYTAAFKNYHQVNTGLATMLNECIEKAHGKYLKLIAADDFLHPESIEKCVAKLEKEGEECGMVFTDFFPINEKYEPIDFLFNYQSSCFFDRTGLLKKDQLIKFNCIIAPSVLLRKQVILETGRYDPSIILEDHHRWLLINEKKSIGFVNEKLAYYRILGTSVASTQHAKMIEDDMYLKIKFDKTGINKKIVYDYILKKYQANSSVPKYLKNEYYKYPFRVKRLTFALKSKIHPIIYKQIFSTFKF